MTTPAEITQWLDNARGALGASDTPALCTALDALARAALNAPQRLDLAARVAELADTAPPQAEARLRNLQGQLLTESGDLDSARAALLRCVSLADAHGPADLQWKAHTTLGIAQAMAGNLPAAMQHLNHAVAAASHAGDLRAVGRTLINIGNTQNEMGRHSEAAETARRAIEIAAQTGDGAAALSARVLLGLSLMRGGELEQAEATWLAAIQPALELGAQRTVGNLYANLAVVRQRRGYLAQARQYFEHAARHFQVAGARHETAAVLASLGSVLVDEGELEAAIHPLREAAEAHQRGGDTADAAHARCTLAGALATLGRADEAEVALAPARALCTPDAPADLQFALAGAEYTLARARRDWPAALDHAQAHRRLGRTLDEPAEEAAGLCHAALAHEAAGDPARAESAAEQAIALLAQSGLAPGTSHLEMLALLARTALRAGRRHDAAELVDRALATAEELPLFHESEGARVRALAAELRRLEKAVSRS